MHNKNFQLSEEELKRLSTSRQEWRKDLKEDDKIDVYIVADDKDKVHGWVQGQIDSVNGDSLSIVLPDLPPDYDVELDRWSTDIAKFESKTEEDHKWRTENLKKLNLVDFVCDMHDKIKWEEGTVFNIVEDNTGGRSVLLGNCGFRVYRDHGKKMRQDERGTFDGWSSRYDEYIPIFSPRIQGHLTRVDEPLVQEENEDIDLDDLINPEPGHDRVYCVPRVNSCTS